MIDTLGSEYVQAARLNGLPERRIIRRYALRNALAPSVQVFAVSIQALFGGVIVTEVLFSYPGLGAQLVNAVEAHDTTLVQGIALLIATFYILVNVVADVRRGRARAAAEDRGLRRPAMNRLRFAKTGSGAVGLALLVDRARCSCWSGRSSPRTRRRSRSGCRALRPDAAYPLGLDKLGRDVLSRLLWGGRSVVGSGRGGDARLLRGRAPDRRDGRLQPAARGRR